MATDYARTIAQNLRRLLYERDLNATELARALSVNKSSVSKWLNGASVPRDETLDQISAFFGVDRSEIVVGKNDRTSSPLLSDSSLQLLLDGFQHLNADGRAELLKYLKYIESRDDFIAKKGDQISEQSNVS